MNKKQIFQVLCTMFYAIAVFQIADHGFNTYAIVTLGLGTIMLSLSKKGENK